MKTLEKRLFHLFSPADVARARDIGSVAVAAPRVGQVRATVSDGDQEHEVQLELAAHRRGGMTLETRCSTAAGRAGRPCAILAAVLLEVDRRGLLAGIHDQTPVTLDIVADEPQPAEAAEAGDDEDDPPEPVRGPKVRSLPVRGATAPARGGQRMPAWATELEERRRLVEPAVRAHFLEIPDARRTGGALVFLLDLAASADARAAVLVPARMQLDVAGNATGRPRPVELGTGGVELDALEPRLAAMLDDRGDVPVLGEVVGHQAELEGGASGFRRGLGGHQPGSEAGERRSRGREGEGSEESTTIGGHEGMIRNTHLFATPPSGPGPLPLAL